MPTHTTATHTTTVTHTAGTHTTAAAKDAQGHALSLATPEAAAHIDAAVRAFTLNYGDVAAHLSAAEQAAAAAPFPTLLRAWLNVLANDHAQTIKARHLIETLTPATLSEREQAHLKALRLATAGAWPSAVAVLDRHLMRTPHDLAAHQAALRLDGYLGRFHRTAARSARALPAWSKAQPGYGIMLSFYGFGLEEATDYARAEDVAREAAVLEPFGYWPHHAVSHVLEMTGRPAEGVRWMDEREAFWSAPHCNNRVHIWWHKALYHIELGDTDAALAIYDGPILAAMRPVGTQLCNATALLWRLETLGCDAGARWRHQHDLWQRQTEHLSSPFNEIHAAMTALRVGDHAAHARQLARLKVAAVEAGELAPAFRDTALPVVEAMADFTAGRYRETVDRLLPVEPDLWRMGGSTAQRDLIEWTLTEAAIRSRDPTAALALAHQRLALRPGSAVNKRFLARAEGM